MPDYDERQFSNRAPFGYESLGLLTGIEVVLANGEERAYYSAWGTEQNRDETVHKCPDQQGRLIPAIITLNEASFTPP